MSRTKFVWSLLLRILLAVVNHRTSLPFQDTSSSWGLGSYRLTYSKRDIWQLTLMSGNNGLKKGLPLIEILERFSLEPRGVTRSTWQRQCRKSRDGGVSSTLCAILLVHKSLKQKEVTLGFPGDRETNAFLQCRWPRFVILTIS